jgi:hypothetical protein
MLRPRFATILSHGRTATRTGETDMLIPAPPFAILPMEQP